MPLFIKRLLYALPVLIIACTLCYFYVDQPVARWAFRVFGATHHALGNGHLTTLLTELVYVALVPIMFVYVYLRLTQKTGRFRDCLELVSITVPVAFFIKTPIQYILGRYAPRYYYNETLLFVRKSALYGFHLFQGGSFPSGHMCVFSAAAVAICTYYRKLFWPAVAALMLLAFLLVAFNYHFVGDILAGTFLGLAIGMVCAFLQSNRTF